MCVVDAVIKCRHRSLKAQLWRRQRFRALCPFCSCVCPCLAPTELVIDSINNCVQGSLGVHWVTRGVTGRTTWEVLRMLFTRSRLTRCCVSLSTHIRARRLLRRLRLHGIKHNLFIAHLTSAVNPDITPTYLTVDVLKSSSFSFSDSLPWSFCLRWKLGLKRDSRTHWFSCVPPFVSERVCVWAFYLSK